MFIRSGSFEDWLVNFEMDRNSDDEVTKSLSDELHIMKKVIEHEGDVIYIEGTQHFNFTDLQFYSELVKLSGITGDINGKRGSNIVNEYVLDFFNKQLKGTGGDLIQGPNDLYPGGEICRPRRALINQNKHVNSGDDVNGMAKGKTHFNHRLNAGVNDVSSNVSHGRTSYE